MQRVGIEPTSPVWKTGTLPIELPLRMWTPGLAPGLEVLQTSALPIELNPRSTPATTPPAGVEPATFRLTTGRSFR